MGLPQHLVLKPVKEDPAQCQGGHKRHYPGEDQGGEREGQRESPPDAHQLPPLRGRQAVPDAADRLQGRFCADLLQLGAQPADVHVQGARGGQISMVPDPLDYLFAREQMAGPGEKQFQQVVLLGVEGDLPLGGAHGMSVAVEHQVPGRQGGGLGLPCR